MGFKARVRGFLDEHFGSILAENYIRMIQKQKGIANLDTATDKEQEGFMFALCQKIYGKMMKPDDLKKQTYLVFYKIFGAERAMQSFGKSDVSIQPITFLYFVFGKMFGEFVLEQGEKIYDEKDIKKQDELKQVLFVKKLLNAIFEEFPEKYREEINVRFLIFLKFGENPEKDILKFLNAILSADNLEASLNLMESILHFFAQNSEGTIARPTDTQMMDVMNALGLSDADKANLLRQLNMKLDKFKDVMDEEGKKETEHVVSDVKQVLASQLGGGEADEIVSEALDTLGVKDISSADSGQKKLFLQTILSSSGMGNQSFQKRMVVEDKLRSLLM
jgi:hypothetical protein